METQQIYTKEESADLRSKIINAEIVPTIKVVFDKYPQLQSAMLLVAQYWDDGASDAVHNTMIYSVLPTPLWDKELLKTDYDNDSPVNLPGLPNLDEIDAYVWEYFAKLEGEGKEYFWENNENAVPLFAAYCQEGCHQEMDYLEAYTPYAVFRRKEEEIEIEVVGNMLRPWLDGLRP
jgi:hypothetical protein